MRFRIYPALLIASLLIAAFALVTPAKAQPLDGNYQCVRLEFQGQSSPCQSPPLVLNRDGSYEIWGERGTYEVVQGNWLVLSHSEAPRPRPLRQFARYRLRVPRGWARLPRHVPPYL